MKADFIFRWCAAFRILGLNYTLPTWKLMGLNIPSETQCQLQLFLREGYAQCEQVPDYLQAYVLVETTLGKITTHLGKKVSIEIRNWYKKYFLIYRDDCKVSYAWRNQLATMGAHYPGIPGKPETNALGFHNERYHYILDNIRDKFAIPFLESEDIIDQLEKEVEEIKCSDWDVDVFSKIRQQDGDILIIFAIITETALNFSLAKFWDCLQTEFSKTEIESLVNWLKSRSNKNCIPLVLKEREYQIVDLE